MKITSCTILTLPFRDSGQGGEESYPDFSLTYKSIHQLKLIFQVRTQDGRLCHLSQFSCSFIAVFTHFIDMHQVLVK